MTLDYLIKNGLVIDGSNTEPVEAHIGIQGDRIAYVRRDSVPAREVLDAKGLVVSPGFIDTHGHSEFTLLADGRAEGKVAQGVTTEINGNCGLSAAPLLNEAFERRETDLAELGITERWSTFGEYFVFLEQKGIALNYGTLCGHGNLRASVMGYKDRAPESGELSKMKMLLLDAQRAGAKGLSTGLIYPPGVYSETTELIELARVLLSSRPHGIYASHMRGEGDTLLEAINEVVTIGEEAAVKVHVSHIKTAGEQNWTKIDRALQLIESARENGVAVTCDRYPYVASSTDLDTVLPSWVYEGGVEEEMRRLREPDTRKRIKAALTARSDDYWRRVLIASVIRAENKWAEGQSVFDSATAKGKRTDDFVLDLIVDEKTRVDALFFFMSEENLRRFMSLPYMMIGSDSAARSFSGPTVNGKPHPRGFGTFPRFLGTYVREGGIMSLPEAIHKMTYLPAVTFGLRQRGLIQRGFYADLTLFRYDRIRDLATFDKPFARPEGIEYVFVNGTLAIREGEYTGSLTGRIMR